MHFTKTNGSGCHDWSTCVIDFSHFLAEMLLDVSQSGLSIHPSSGILWFFLSPCNTGVFVLLQIWDNFLEWEWAERFNSKNNNIIFLLLCSFFFKIKVNLTRCKDNFGNLIIGYTLGVRVWDQRLPFGTFTKGFKFRCCTFESQQFLWWSNH